MYPPLLSPPNTSNGHENHSNMKRTLESYFPLTTGDTKRRTRDSSFLHNGNNEADQETLPPSTHATSPFPISQLPHVLRSSLIDEPLASSTAGALTTARVINDRPNLDLLYFEPFVPRDAHAALFGFLRAALPFYRVEYTIHRPSGGDSGAGGDKQSVVASGAASTPTLVRTPRFTTVFGVDATSRFARMGDDDSSQLVLVDAATGAPVPADRYRCTPRPIPECLDTLRLVRVVSRSVP